MGKRKATRAERRDAERKHAKENGYDKKKVDRFEKMHKSMMGYDTGAIIWVAGSQKDNFSCFVNGRPEDALEALYRGAKTDPAVEKIVRYVGRLLDQENFELTIESLIEKGGLKKACGQVLIDNGVSTIGDMKELSDGDLLAFRNLGEGKLKEIRDATNIFL